MAQRIEFRLRGLLIAAAAVIALLPVVATREIGVATRVVDEILEEGVPALERLDDVMQALLDLRSGALEAALPDALLRRDRTPAIERSLLRLGEAAQRLERGDVETLIGGTIETETLNAIRETGEAGAAYLSMLVDPEADPATFARGALVVSRSADRSATRIETLADRVRLEARLVETAVPRHLRIARYACFVLAGVALATLGLLVVERLKFPPSRRELKRSITEQLRAGAFATAGGAAIVAADAVPRRGKPARAPVRIEKLLHARPLHQTFLGSLHLVDGNVRVWGKHYTMLGALRGRLIPFVPMYGPGAWRILCTFERRGIDGPRPVAFASRRRFGLAMSHTLLATHVGPLSSAKRGYFGTRAFRKLDRDGRARVLDRLCGFIDDLNAAGCFQLKMRYVHVRGETSIQTSPDEPRFVLCDLDKVLHLPWIPRRLKRVFARRDRHRIVRNLGGELTHRELERLSHWADTSVLRTERPS